MSDGAASGNGSTPMSQAPSKGTVVVADDSPTLRRIVSTVLGRAGYAVVLAEDGVQAIQATFAHQPVAVVLDVQMPRITGYVAARLLKEDWQTSDIPVILLTSLEAATDRYWGDKAGAARYLTKDFEAPELAGAVDEVVAAALASVRGRVLRADPVELSDDDVLTKVCDLLDRKLFESSVAGDVLALAVTGAGFELTVAGLLDVVRRFVDYHLASVMLLDERVAYVGVAHECTRGHYAEFLRAAAATAADASGTDYVADALDARVADPMGLLGSASSPEPAEDDEGPVEEMATFLSMPLRGRGGKVVGVLAASSARKDAFSESSLTTLKLIEGPAAVVIDNARLSVAYAG